MGWWKSKMGHVRGHCDNMTRSPSDPRRYYSAVVKYMYIVAIYFDQPSYLHVQEICHIPVLNYIGPLCCYETTRKRKVLDFILMECCVSIFQKDKRFFLISDTTHKTCLHIRIVLFQEVAPIRYPQQIILWNYSEIPLLRPPKIKTFYLLKTLFWKFKLFFFPFSTTIVHLIRDHLWDCPKVVFKTTFGQSQRWS